MGIKLPLILPYIGDLSNEYSGSHGNVVDLLLRRCMFCSVSRISHGWDRENQLGFYMGMSRLFEVLGVLEESHDVK